MRILTKSKEEQLWWSIERDVRGEFEQEYKVKLQEMKHKIIFEAVGKLNDMSDKDKVGVAVRVETDNAGAIRMIIGEMSASVANALLGKAKKSLLERLND